MKLVLLQLEILSGQKKKNTEENSGFVSVPASVCLYTVDDLSTSSLG